jgi:hypothetical protein
VLFGVEQVLRDVRHWVNGVSARSLDWPMCGGKVRGP